MSLHWSSTEPQANEGVWALDTNKYRKAMKNAGKVTSWEFHNLRNDVSSWGFLSSFIPDGVLERRGPRISSTQGLEKGCLVRKKLHF